MRRALVSILSLVVCISSAFAESLLTAQKFPKTFKDLSFKSRMDFMMDDYAAYNPEYDENGVCISGCAYPGITIKEEMQAVDAANEEMENLIQQAQGTLHGSGVQNADWCLNGLSTKLPLRFPVDMSNLKYKISGDFGFRSSSKNGARFHPALDIACPKGTPVYATADGTVAAVRYERTPGGAGWYINIQHENGIISQYLHLDNVFVKEGDAVQACQHIANSGNSGISMENKPYAAHLDYRIKFKSDVNKYVDILCPCKNTNKNTGQSSNTDLNLACAHSLFNASYKFQAYDPNSNDIKRSLWRVQHGHCMQTNTDLLPDEVK